MEVHFLGTGAAEGWPGLFCECEMCERARVLGGKNVRTRSSIIIDGAYKVDLPPDNYLHMLRHGFSLAEVKHLFITHTHYDHFHPDDLLMRRKPFAHIRDRKPLHIYGNRQVLNSVMTIVKEHPEINIVTHLAEPLKPLEADRVKALPLPADHAENQVSLLYLFEMNGKTVLHGYDSGWFPEDTWRALKGYIIDLVILDCTNGALPYVKYHMGVKGVIETRRHMLSEGIASKDTTFVATHFSHNGGLLHESLVSKLSPEGIQVAFDGLTIRL
ncbi:MAG: carbon-phosphorus lyase [Candidatus Bathyarchaeota archaeon B26-2]|nr:MAG: carbon-phosphorus lyase [Candidatus Bathyarchaeota archaeon B26-2]